MPAVNPSTYTTGGADAGTISTDSTTVTMASIPSGGAAYIYYDFGVGIIQDFVIQATVNVTAASGLPAIWPLAVGNDIGDADDLDTADDGLGLYMSTAVLNILFQVKEFETDSTSSLTSPGLSGSTDIFVTFERSGTTLTITTRLNSHMDTPEDMESVTCPTTAYRYLYLGQSRGISSGTQSYTLADITQDITETTTDYTIECMTQTYVVTPTVTLLKIARFNAETGAFIVASVAATLLNQHFLGADTGLFYTDGWQLVIFPDESIELIESVAGPLQAALVVDPPVIVVETAAFLVTPATTMIGMGTSFQTTTQTYIVAGQDIDLAGVSLIPSYIYIGGN